MHVEIKGLHWQMVKYLAFIDSDNQWYKDKLIKQLEIIEDSSLNIDFVYSKEEVIDEKFVTIVPRESLFNGRA